MLRRLEMVQMDELVPYVVFGFTFAVFLFVFFRACRMKRSSAERLAALPLGETEKDENDN